MNKIFLSLAFFFSVQLFFYSYSNDIDKPKYFSQFEQDKALNEEIFKWKRNGFFVDIGAYDGIWASNSYFFEKNLGWEGICVEPNPDVFNRLRQNRTCYCEQCCVSDVTGQKLFLKCTDCAILYSGLLDSFDQRDIARIDQTISTRGGKKEVVFVKCFKLKELLQKYNVKHIDFLSVDVEGAEEAVIKSIDFDEVNIEVIVIENNYKKNNVKMFLESKGFVFIKRLGVDDLFLKNNDPQKSDSLKGG